MLARPILTGLTDLDSTLNGKEQRLLCPRRKRWKCGG